MSNTVTRSQSSLNAKLERNLVHYALAAGAAGAGLLALAPVSTAEVLYTPAHVRIGNGDFDFYDLDLNNDGTTEVEIAASNDCHFTCEVDLYARGIGSPAGAFQVGKLGPRQAVARKSGGKIGPQKMFNVYGTMARRWGNSSGGTGRAGSWVDVQNRYLGLTFNIGNKTHYGWARFNVHFFFDTKFEVKAVLTGYAYETIPDKPIVAGDEGKAAKSLGHLALGAAGRH
jgi:hypothetical protein